MKRFALFATSALFAVACKDSAAPPVATTISLSASSLSLDAIGASETVTATITDQYGQPMPSAAITWTSSSAAATVLPVNSSSPASATVTAALNGLSTITATAGSAHASLNVTIAQVPAALQKASGDAQAAAVNSLLPSAIVVRVVDRMGVPVSGQNVSFAVTKGGGSITQATSTTLGDGTALTGWTLGKVASDAQSATASLGALTPVSFTATAVAGAPAKLTVIAGDGQTATVGSPVPIAPQIAVTDAFSNVVGNAMVSFTVSDGFISSASAPTNASGIASAGLWTLGTTPGTKTLTASLSGIAPVSVSATAVVGPPADLILSGNNQSATVGTQINTPPSVKIVDAFANPIAGIKVVFAVTSGGGTITGATQTTNAGGIATLGSWTLGLVPGTNTLSVALDPVAVSIATRIITATGVPGTGSTGGLAGSISIQSGSNQAAMAGSAVPVPPTVIVRDINGNPLSGIPVTFSVTGGGGVVTGAIAVSNAAGVATVGGWTLGGVAVLNTLSASAPNVGTLTFTAAGCEGGGAGYAITVCYRSTMTTAQRQAFVDAANRWKSVITSDLPDVQANVGEGQCDTNTPSLSLTVDDLLIFAAVEPIDGAGAILGSAGWCFRRTAGLPVIGTMRFDVADVATLESRNQFGAVIMHEMGHVIGVGSMWTAKSLLQNASSGSATTDTYFSGTNGIAGFDAIGGTTYTLGLKVPVENIGGIGTMNAHWRESVLQNELMTGFLNTGANPLSMLTVRSLQDLGYTVNTGAADPFFLALSLQSSLLAPDPTALRLENDVYTGKQSTISPKGTIVRLR